MKTPKRFKLIDKTINVEIDKDFLEKEDKLGYANYQENKITLDGSDTWKDQEQLFLHELIHFILYMMGNDLESDEKFVNLFSCLLHQALDTMEYKHEN